MALQITYNIMHSIPYHILESQGMDGFQNWLGEGVVDKFFGGLCVIMCALFIVLRATEISFCGRRRLVALFSAGCVLCVRNISI